MKELDHYYRVVIKSGSTKEDLFAFETENEAIQWCNDNHWEWMDENEFVWECDIEERNEDIAFFEDEDFINPEDEPDGEDEDTQGVVGPDDSYRSHDTLLKAMDAAGWWFNDLESYTTDTATWLWFHGDYGFSMSFDSWRELEEWLLGVVFDDKDIGCAVEQIMKGE